MIVNPHLISEAAAQAGIKLPPDLENYDKEEYPHWHLFCSAQLGVPIPYWDCHWENAKVIASISEDRVKTITVRELRDAGFAF